MHNTMADDQKQQREQPPSSGGSGSGERPPPPPPPPPPDASPATGTGAAAVPSPRADNPAPLPPPPPPPTFLNSNLAAASAPPPTSAGGPPQPLPQPLPPPPPMTASTSMTGPPTSAPTSATSATSAPSPASYSYPAAPFSAPPPPTAASTTASTSMSPSALTEPPYGKAHHGKGNKKKKHGSLPSQKTHSVREAIPALNSAPNSGSLPPGTLSSAGSGGSGGNGGGAGALSPSGVAVPSTSAPAAPTAPAATASTLASSTAAQSGASSTPLAPVTSAPSSFGASLTGLLSTAASTASAAATTAAGAAAGAVQSSETLKGALASATDAVGSAAETLGQIAAPIGEVARAGGEVGVVGVGGDVGDDVGNDVIIGPTTSMDDAMTNNASMRTDATYGISAVARTPGKSAREEAEAYFETPTPAIHPHLLVRQYDPSLAQPHVVPVPGNHATHVDVPPPPPPPGQTQPPPPPPQQPVGAGQPIPSKLMERADRQLLAKSQIPRYSRMDSGSMGNSMGAMEAGGETAATRVESAPPIRPPPPPPPPPAAAAMEAAPPTHKPTAVPTPTAAAATSTAAQPSSGRLPSSLVTPPLATLSRSQSSIPILILATEASRNLAAKNNLTLAEMFNYVGSTIHSSGQVPRLPPFRSVGRSMMLSWDQIAVRFVDSSDLDVVLDGSYMAEVEGELSYCANVWPQDGDLDGEIEELEGRVGDVVAEDVGWDRTSAKKKTFGEVQYSHHDHGGGEGHHQAQQQQLGGAVAAAEKGGTVSLQESAPMPGSMDRASSTGTTAPHQAALLHEDSFSSTTDVASPAQTAADAAFALTSTPTIPWLLRFRNALDRTSTGTNSTHDFMACPPLVMLVACTDDAVPVDALAELSNPHFLPRPYHDGRYDPNSIRREYVMLHDNMDGPSNFAGEGVVMKEMQSRFGVGCCAVVRVNSGGGGTGEEGENLAWGTHVPRPKLLLQTADGSGDKMSAIDYSTLGNRLSVIDLQNLRRYVGSLVSSSLLPSVERRISNLNIQVSNHKKGMKNMMKGFFRKSKDSGAESYHGNNNGAATAVDGSTGGYPFSSIESQTRLLADTLFLMRDYENALSMYRLVKDDYRQDRAHLHHASVNELIGLCVYLVDPYGQKYGREAFNSLETAFYGYQRAAEEERAALSKASGESGGRPTSGTISTRLATRLGLVLSARRELCAERPMEVADLLASASSHETALGAAVLLEQSASHYYKANAARKYAFHMLMAGHMFRSAGQESHAFRCFASSLYVYRSGRWDELYNHLRSALAAQLYGMGRMSTSLRLYAGLVGTTGGGRVSVRSQQKFLNHLAQICRDFSDKAMEGAEGMRRFVDAPGKAVDPCGEVLVSTPGSKKVLEIPGMDLPRINDSSVVIGVDGVGGSSRTAVVERMDSIQPSDHEHSGSSLGIVSEGSESEWQDMMCSVQAELRAASSSSDVSAGEHIAQVIAEIDKEKAELAFAARAKRKGGNVGSPEKRARMEPLTVSFELSNPLGVQIRVTDVQLVARMTCSETARTCTNEGAVEIDGDADVPTGSKNRSWRFGGSASTFGVPEFARVSSPEEQRSWHAAHHAEGGPFYVVTKTDLVMEPGTTTSLELGLCPLVQGDMEIIGVRCKLFDEIWVYHRFHIEGPLLQDTRHNRANRVRGKSYLLESKVEADMPRLVVDLVPSSEATAPSTGEAHGGATLQGQVSGWTLRVSNIGTAPARNVTLKTNVPWISIVPDDATGDREVKATSRCIGPTGTMMSIPLKSTKTPRNEAAILYPGDSTDISIRIRTSGGGRQEFYMLFRYELYDEKDQSPSTSPRFRWLRKMLNVPVYPSLTMTASLQPSTWNKDEHILSIEMTNYRSDRQSQLEISLEKVCVASRYYAAKALASQLDPTSDEQTQGEPLQIGWQERMTMHYLITPVETSEAKFMLSQCCHFGGENSDAHGGVDESLTDFVCLENAHERFKAALMAHDEEMARIAAEQENEGQPRHVSQIRRAKSALKGADSQDAGDDAAAAAAADIDNHPTSIASLCPKKANSEINLICAWSTTGSANDERVHGQHHLRQLAVRPRRKSKGCPLMVTARHKSEVSHDFASGPLYTEVEVTVSNRLVESDVDFEFAVDRQAGFEFIGAECFKWTLAGGEELVIPFTAEISRSGVYNLQSLRLTVQREDVDVPYYFPWQWLIKVSDL